MSGELNVYLKRKCGFFSKEICNWSFKNIGGTVFNYYLSNVAMLFVNTCNFCRVGEKTLQQGSVIKAKHGTVSDRTPANIALSS